MVANHFLTAVTGLLFGVALVAWVRPDTSAGAVFLVVVVTLAALVVGAIARGLIGLYRKNGAVGRSSSSP